MFDFDLLQEIGKTIKENKLRTFLTGFSITWGIFMLIVLLGSGNGLRNGIESNFSYRAKNSVIAFPGATSLPYKGLPLDRVIQFKDEDLEMIRTQLPEVDHISGVINHQGILSYDKEYGSWNMQGVHPDASYINNVDMSIGRGRFINEIDIEKRRKVIVINTEIEDVLFKNIDPIGKYIISGGLSFKIIGIYKDEAGKTNVPAYIPFSTAQSLFSKNYGMDRIDFTIVGIETMEQNEEFIDRFMKKMADLHKFDSEDKSALMIFNTAAQAVQSAQIFNTINIFVWVVGFFTLVAGIVGIGNIMLITVKERTREFGIRKAIGASPASILRLVLLESIIITSAFGVFGIMLGIGLTEFVGQILEMSAQSAETHTIFKDPTVGIGIVIQATIILIISGIVAGCIPALKAVRINPIAAMRAE